MVEVFNKKEPNAGIIDANKKNRILGEIIFEDKESFKIHSSSILFKKKDYMWVRVP